MEGTNAHTKWRMRIHTTAWIGTRVLAYLHFHAYAYVGSNVCIYLAASRDRHLAIRCGGLGNRLCYAWLDAGLCKFRTGWMLKQYELASMEFVDFV
jgi:hypothetical protein